MTTAGTTADRIVEVGRTLITMRGYNGFSYADVAAAIGIRKASIHHHFPTKPDLAAAVIGQSRAAIDAQIDLLTATEPDAMAQLRAYVGYWERCILDDDAPFCVAGMLAAELPSLPVELARSVESHFDALKRWLIDLLILGERQGSIALSGYPADEADDFIAGVYGAMLSTRACRDRARCAAIAERHLARIARG